MRKTVCKITEPQVVSLVVQSRILFWFLWLATIQYIQSFLFLEIPGHSNFFFFFSKRQFLKLFCTGSPPPVRALETEATSVPRVSLGTPASTVNGKVYSVLEMERNTKIIYSTSFFFFIKTSVITWEGCTWFSLWLIIFFLSFISCALGYVGNPQERQRCHPYDGKKYD